VTFIEILLSFDKKLMLLQNFWDQTRFIQTNM
jgi:hypothetical protein